MTSPEHGFLLAAFLFVLGTTIYVFVLVIRAPEERGSEQRGFKKHEPEGSWQSRE
jgi:hypothetical protein